MHRSVPRSLSLLGVIAAFAVTAAPAHAYTPPIGTDKGSVVAVDRSAKSVSSTPAQPAASGIIAILIGL